MSVQANLLILSGRVQGVGFRPFVYGLAQTHQINGWVRNVVGRVEIHAEGNSENLALFRHDLVDLSPPLSKPVVDKENKTSHQDFSGFSILDSETTGAARIHLPPDTTLCNACESEFNDTSDRRYHYPFINCTQCGPRYTIISAIPYDRVNTSMSRFKLCAACLQEYQDPANRRFHAEPNACAKCGPSLSFTSVNIRSAAKAVIDDSPLALQETVMALQAGHIIAVKGLGGYHLVCDATNRHAVQRLRANKNRPHKPLALMVRASGADTLAAIHELVELEDKAQETAAALASMNRPIVLLKKKKTTIIAPEVAPDLDEFGIMLPPSPLHSLLAEQFGKPLVVTSGNISGEPVLTDDDETSQRLAHIADGFLTHNREILRPADDSVLKPIAGHLQLIRSGRGFAPLEFELPVTLPQPILAVGGQLKNTIALAWEKRVVISPHIGDLSTHRSMQVFEQVINDLQAIYQVQAELILCDAHPHYASTRWAKSQHKDVIQIQHHQAHAASLMDNEQSMKSETLVFAWDGAGYGEDGSIWGGETFIGSPGSWQRVASLQKFRLPGGEKAALQPWRSAAALHWQLNRDYDEHDTTGLVRKAWQQNLNCFETSSIGRLFDAAASMLGLVQSSSHEGEAPMRLESLAVKLDIDDCLPCHWQSDILQIDWSPLLDNLQDKATSREYRAGYFHAVMANTLARIVTILRQHYNFDKVGLCGGVFQNSLLTELIQEQFELSDIKIILPTRVPANDGGLSYGQIIEYAARQHRTVGI